jgi:8-oxo-dGTP pyrophosphatase MutT (NUDIX family)
MKEILIDLFKEELPGYDAHQEMLPVKADGSRRRFSPNVEYVDSGVAILLYPNEDSLNTILIQRTSYNGVHSGQISFPGGKKERFDNSLEQTARRECTEEINQDMSSAVLIKKMSDIYIPVSNFRVAPYVFWVDSVGDLLAEQREVNTIIKVNTSMLIDTSIIKSRDMKFGDGIVRKNIPYFDIHGHVVWGATAMILSELRHYLNKIP